MYNKEQITELLRQYKYPDFAIDGVVAKLNNMEPEMSALFEKWLQTKEIPNDEINGFTFVELTDKYKFTPINAFLTLNWLIVDPENASAALEGGIR